MDEGHQDRDHAPGDHDASDPAAGPPAFYNQRPRDFQQEVAEKENTRTKANDAFAETKIVWHLQRRGANVHAVDEGNHIKQEEEREKAPRDATPGSLSHLGVGGAGR